MKNLYASLFVFVISFHCIGQTKNNSTTVSQKDLIGIWQVNSAIAGAGLQSCFYFYTNGNYNYHTSSYDNLNPIAVIYGRYKLSGNSLMIKVDSIKQWTGYRIIPADPGVQSAPFQLDGGKMTIIRQNDKSYLLHSIKWYGASMKAIEIDSDKYFKISADPFKEP